MNYRPFLSEVIYSFHLDGQVFSTVNEAGGVQIE